MVDAKYLGVYLGGLDLADKQRLSWRWVWMWIVESSTVWGNVQSIVEVGCAWSHEMERFCWRGWNTEVFPISILVGTCSRGMPSPASATDIGA